MHFYLSTPTAPRIFETASSMPSTFESPTFEYRSLPFKATHLQARML